jgi:hypothetical protein
VHCLPGAPGGPLLAADLGDDRPGVPVIAWVTYPMSAERATSRKGTSWWARALTIGWPCGGLGVMDGPLTRKWSPAKSM